MAFSDLSRLARATGPANCRSRIVFAACKLWLGQRNIFVDVPAPRNNLLLPSTSAVGRFASAAVPTSLGFLGCGRRRGCSQFDRFHALAPFPACQFKLLLQVAIHDCLRSLGGPIHFHLQTQLVVRS